MYKITEYGYGRLMERVAKLNKKSSNDITVTVIGKNIEKVNIEGEHIDVMFYNIDITEKRQLLGNWEIVAVKKSLEKSALFFPVAGNIIPEKYHNNKMDCEHCGYNRNRTCVIILKNINTGELKQVGKSCLKEFCGLSLSESLYIFEELSHIKEELDDGFYCGCGGYNCRHINVKAYLNFVYDCIAKYGYKKFDAYNQNKFDYDNWENNFTKDNALMMYKQLDKPASDNASSAITCYINTKQDSEFFENVCNLLSEDYIPAKYINMITFIPYFYIKSMERLEVIRQRQKENAEKNNSYAAAVGEKFSGKVTLKHVYVYDTQFGITRIYSFLDERKRTIIWKTANGLDIEKDDICTISGKCKENNEYNGICQTVLTRCKITK